MNADGTVNTRLTTNLESDCFQSNEAPGNLAGRYGLTPGILLARYGLGMRMFRLSRDCMGPVSMSSDHRM